jgi:hypothetical protein
MSSFRAFVCQRQNRQRRTVFGDGPTGNTALQFVVRRTQPTHFAWTGNTALQATPCTATHFD